MSEVNSQGAAVADMSQGSTGAEGNRAPEIVNTPPAKTNGDAKNVNEVDAAEAARLAAAAAKPADQAKNDGADAETFVVGHEAADASMAILKDAGVTKADMDFIFGKARVSGKLSDINIQAIEAKVGKQKAALVMAGVEAYHRDATGKATAIASTVHEVAGGKEAWDKVAGWVNAKAAADPAFRAEVAEMRGMLNAGGKQAKLAAKALVDQYNADPNTKGLANGSLVKGDSASTGMAPMGRAEYLAEYKKAEAKGDTVAMSILSSRRAAGRKAGLR